MITLALAFTAGAWVLQQLPSLPVLWPVGLLLNIADGCLLVFASAHSAVVPVLASRRVRLCLGSMVGAGAAGRCLIPGMGGP